jgi:hypothetical protein
MIGGFSRAALLTGLIFMGYASLATAAESYTLVIKDHVITPAEIKVPAGKDFQLLVKNQDPTPEEFESHELRVEKIIPGGKEAVIPVRALKAGKYPFIGEFNESTAKGVLIAE